MTLSIAHSSHPYLLAAGVVCVLIWLYLLLLHGRFWRVDRLLPNEPPLEYMKGPIAVVIPARNEAEGIGRAVSSLLRQSCAEVMHVFVMDDNSSDGTGEVARAAAISCGHVDAVTVISGRPLEPGWTGKMWAVQQGVEQALLLQPRFLLLTDADIEHGPESVATLAAIAERQKYDLVSFMVQLHCRSLAERLLIPAFMFFFFLLYPPDWIRSARHRTAGAAGGCMLIRPEALQRAGGIAAIRQEIIDDCALARAVKRSGGRVWLGTTGATRSLREYGSFAEIERMIARTAFNQLQHSALMLIGATLWLALTYLLPLMLVLSGNKLLTAAEGVAYLLMSIAYWPAVRFYGLNFLWALTLPISALFYMAATVHSALKYWSGRGGEWKGRAQDASRQA